MMWTNLKFGFYKLEEVGVKNPNADRRVKDDWNKAIVFPTEYHYFVKDNRICYVTSYRHMTESFDSVIAALLVPVEPTLQDIVWLYGPSARYHELWDWLFVNSGVSLRSVALQLCAGPASDFSATATLVPYGGDRWIPQHQLEELDLLFPRVV
jgi:hypothetical protein